MTIYALGEQVPAIDSTAFVHPDATVIGDVVIGAGASIWPRVVLRGDYGHIEVGSRTSIQDGAVVHATADHPTIVGADCVVGHLAHLEGCVVEPGSLIGSGSIVLHDAVVRTGALVGAGALVTNRTEVPARALALGVPARIKPDAMPPDAFVDNVAQYVENAKNYAANLRAIG